MKTEKCVYYLNVCVINKDISIVNTYLLKDKLMDPFNFLELKQHIMQTRDKSHQYKLMIQFL